jgi:Flp pilus assembly pilin Flp
MNNNSTNSNKEQNKEEGASLVEYALLVALIAVICVVAVRTLGRKASQRFSAQASYL